MEHTHIIQSSDLDRYAPTRDSQATIPELVYWLVKQSCPDLTVCRIPYGDAVNQPGWDGLVESTLGFLEFVPAGKSFWEIGTAADPQSKATGDFRKRTDELSVEQRAASSFVFVTPRSSGAGGWNEPEQSKWLERRKDEGWKLIRIIDGVKLADWLREYPALGDWMAKKLNITSHLGGLSTATDHWDALLSEVSKGDPPFPPALFTIGRSEACDALTSLFEGKTQVLMLFAESQHDVADFVAGFLAALPVENARSFTHRCLYIHEAQAWRSIAETRSPHVLVADPRIGLETDDGAPLLTLARRRGHAVVVPLCGAWSGNNPEILKLRSPTAYQVEAVLRESGYTEMRARELSRIGGDRLSALLRHLRGYGTLPPYATWDTATLIAQAGLAGKWDATNSADRAALEMLLGKNYGEWIERLKNDTLRSDSPLIQQDEKWRFVARGEAWTSLGGRITDDDLERLQFTAINVLSERDPRFDLPKEERYAARVHGKSLANTNLLREGIAETLALLGSRPNSLSACSHGKAQSTAISVVRNLLHNADWERWVSLNQLLPVLAEAAPDEFLDAVEFALVDLAETPFRKVFMEEGGGVLGGSNYMTGLLWALEALAWSPDFLSRVSVILADLASIDPGGNWANRPGNSLSDIFLPWHVQTTASFEKRKAAVNAVICEHPNVGWKLLLSLLPHSHGATSGCHRPVWRNFIAHDWDGYVEKSHYWEQVEAYTELALKLAKSDSQKLCELINRLSDLPEPAQLSSIAYLESHEVLQLTEVERMPIWNCLNDLVRKHRKFGDAQWALPVDLIERLTRTATLLKPTSPKLKFEHLFVGRDYDLFDERSNYEEQRKRLKQSRESAVAEILQNGGVDALLEFAASVTTPQDVGFAFGRVATLEMETAILPRLLDSEVSCETQFVAGFIWYRYWELRETWVESILQSNWQSTRKAKFLTLLPFVSCVWKLATLNLEGVDEALYWKKVNVNPYQEDGNLDYAIEKLLQYGREGAAVNCVARTADDAHRFNEHLAIRSLLAVLHSENGVRELESHETVELITKLQKSSTADADALFRIEWNFLPWLDRFSTGSPVTLEKRLASDADFFAEVVRLIFRSKLTAMELPEPDERQKHLATNAYKLLTDWSRCPGVKDDGSFSAEDFAVWLNNARRLTEESGHAEVAQIQIGHVLTNAPPDPNGLWIHSSVATALNMRDTHDMRSGFTTQLYNNRGVHGFSRGKEEHEIASDYRLRAEALDAKSFTRLASALRELAEQYEREAESESKRNPYGD